MLGLDNPIAAFKSCQQSPLPEKARPELRARRWEADAGLAARGASRAARLRASGNRGHIPLMPFTRRVRSGNLSYISLRERV